VLNYDNKAPRYEDVLWSAGIYVYPRILTAGTGCRTRQQLTPRPFYPLNRKLFFVDRAKDIKKPCTTFLLSSIKLNLTKQKEFTSSSHASLWQLLSYNQQFTPIFFYILWHADPLLGNDREIRDYITAVARIRLRQLTRTQQFHCNRRCFLRRPCRNVTIRTGE
jgi:hypothetical protein